MKIQIFPKPEYT